MKRGIITSLAALVLWGSVGLNFASAQFGTLGQAPIRPRPTVSPYINMGTGAGAYYGIVRPQTDANKTLFDLQQGVNKINTENLYKTAADQAGYTQTTGLQTGHSSGFFNYGHYYPNTPPGGASASTQTGLGSGLGGVNPYFINSNLGLGVGVAAGNRAFFGPNLAQPLIGR